MLSQDDNKLITETGPGTPGGELMRCYWQPVALSEDLPVGCPPLPIRLLSEDLVLFRTEGDRGQGSGVRGHRPQAEALSTQTSALSTTVGLIGLHCSHRGADLSYGRLEDGGLRCIYHGWLYDIQGRCLEQPGEPAGSTFHEKIRHTAYPCVERAGAIFAYLGPGQPPEFPNYEFLLPRPPESRDVTKWYHECNYHQANEGNIDTSHLSFLHYMTVRRGGLPPEPGTSLNHRGEWPWLETMEAERTPYGVRGARTSGRWGPGPEKNINVTEFVLPNLGIFSNDVEVTGEDASQRVHPRYPVHPGYNVNWHVPIDDTHHWKYRFTFSSIGPLKWRIGRGQTEMVDYCPVRNLSNRFQQDREEMLNRTFAGLGTDFYLHDKWAPEGQGPIQNRTAEHLGALDTPLLICREVLLEAIRGLQEGREPANVVRDPNLNRLPITPLRAWLPVAMEWNWREFTFGGSLPAPSGVGGR